jgi:hypothetical protein
MTAQTANKIALWMQVPLVFISLSIAARAASVPDKTKQENSLMGASNKHVRIELGQPVTVAMAPPEVRGWGPYQFPALLRLPDGRIQASFHVEADSATAYGLPPARAVSADEGRTWTLLPREDSTDGASAVWDAVVLLPGGDRLKIKSLCSRKASGLRLPEKPFAQYINYGLTNAVYRVEDLPAECAAGWMFLRLPAGHTQWQEERAIVRLPGEVRTVTEGVMWFPWLSAQMIVAPDGALWSELHAQPRGGRPVPGEVSGDGAALQRCRAKLGYQERDPLCRGCRRRPEGRQTPGVHRALCLLHAGRLGAGADAHHRRRRHRPSLLVALDR